MDERLEPRAGTDTYPLLMEHYQNQQQQQEASTLEHVSLDVVTVQPQRLLQQQQEQDCPSTSAAVSSRQESSSSSNSNINNSGSGGGGSSSSTSSSSSSRSSRSNYSGGRQRISPLNSGLWISIELTITVSQIVASVIVLSLSRDEKPQAPLFVWVAGYAAGCLATLPLLYWRYTHRHGPRARQQEAATPSSASVPSSPRATSYVSLSVPGAVVTRDAESLSARSADTTTEHSNIGRLVEKLKIALDCFFAVWFVVGNVWIFGGHSSSREAPNLYRLCIVFLTFSCIGYAMPFILCATICCCLPCIIALLGFREEQAQNRGAPPEVIAALPTYKFKSKTSKEGKDGSESDSENSLEGGIVGAGTDLERAVAPDDAVCCICLARYKDGDPLRELACTHHFHVECVDKWLKINASCPLCKLEVSGASSENQTSSNGAGDENAS